MSIVLHWKAREQRPFWQSLPGVHAFALRARMQDGNAKDGEANTHYLTGPTGGKDAAFDTFFAQHEHALYGYLRRMLPTHDAALDVAQEAFFRAWQHFETVRGYDRPQAWLFRVATNLALDSLRRRQLRDLTPLFSRREAADAYEGDTSDPTSTLMDPFDMERSLAERDLVNRALLHVAERQRAAMLLWAAHGLTCAEIAAALETTEVNVRQLLSRGRARFREAYEQEQKNN